MYETLMTAATKDKNPEKVAVSTVSDSYDVR